VIKPATSFWGLFGLSLMSWLGGAAVVPVFADDTAASLPRGAEIYQGICATCHGPKGRPDPDSALVQSLGVVPANFADPLFNSREPLSDWKIVVTHGGQALAFSEQMPAYGDSLSEDDIDAVLAYVKTLGGQHDYPDGALNMLLPIRTKKAFPEDEWVWKQRYTEQDGDNTWKNTLEYEFRVGERGQGILELTHEVEGSHSEFGHFEPGFKYVLKHDLRSGFILTGAAQVGVPLNSGAHWEFLPYLAFGKILSDAWTLQGSGRLKLDLEDSDKSSAELAAILHWVNAPRPRWVFPALEVVAEVPFERGTGPDRKSAIQWSAVPQARIGLNKRGNIALNVGVELPLNDRDRYDWRAYVYFIWDFADGGLLEGW
jgi:mono/diheme cytochrome c family protein